MKKVIIAMLAVAAAAACNQVSKTTTVTGSFGEDAPDAVQIQISKYNIDTLVPVVNGSYSIDVPTDVTIIAYETAGGVRGAFIPDGTVLTSTVEDGFFKYVSNKPAKSIQERSNRINDWMDSFMPEFESSEDKDSLMDVYIEKLKSIVKENPDNVLGLMGISSVYSQLEPDELLKLVNTLNPGLRENEEIQAIKKSIEKSSATAVGKMFSDFEVAQPDGTVAKLSDYVGKGKYILVDFWASWCGPCRREIPNVKAAYEKYHGDNFDVLSVAVWDKVEDTRKALEEEQLSWNQIINAQRIPTDIYGIEGIPHIILFGPDGTILKRGDSLRGENLDATLAGYLSK